MSLWDLDIWKHLGDVITQAFTSTASEYGMHIRSSNGTLVFTTEDVTWNQVDSFIVAGGAGFSKSYPVLTGRQVLVTQAMINAPPVNRRAIAHTIAVSGNNVSVSGGSETSLILVLMK